MSLDARDPRDGLPQVPFAEATRLWARIGLLSFGGPAGQIALMHRLLVDEKRWIGESRFLHALNFCMLLPGPEAQQLATYVGWLLHGTRGGLVAGTLFIVPGFLVILALSYLYVLSGSVALVQGIFAGLKPAVVVIVVQALLRVGRRSLRSRGHVAIAALAFLAIYGFAIPFPYVIVLAALCGLFAARAGGTATASSNTLSRSDLRASARNGVVLALLWIAPIALSFALLGREHVYTRIALFFSKVAVVSFGGAYAVLSYVSQGAVQGEGWLSAAEMIDGLALAETTPGPLILVLQFVGFLAAHHQPGALHPALAALLGALLTLWVTFVPCFLWIFVGAPHVERLRHHRLLAGMLATITAAVVGAIAQLALWFAVHALFEQTRLLSGAGLHVLLPELASVRWPELGIVVLLVVLSARWRVSIPVMLVVAAGLGVLARVF